MPKWYFDEEREEFKGDPLYFIREGHDGPIKIGRGPAKGRVSNLQVGNPRDLHILGELPTMGYTEALWHVVFANLRLRGEWFRPHESLLSAIRWALKGQAWADEIPAPDKIDQAAFAELMLDACELYDDMVFDGKPEMSTAKHVIADAYARAAEHDLDSMEEALR